MTWRSATFITVNAALLTWNLWGATTHAQVPEKNEQGVPYLQVNINPAGAAPAVNVNPGGKSGACRGCRTDGRSGFTDRLRKSQ